jgi:hypothetical protein
MQVKPLLLFAACLVAITSCGPYEGPVLNANDPKRLVPCQQPAIEDRAHLSFEALDAVLLRNDWFIVSESLDTKTIEARKCKDTRSSRKAAQSAMDRHQSECLDIQFVISSSGAVTVVNPQEKRFYWKIEPEVKGWIEDVEADYVQVRCYDTNALAFWRQAGN